MSIFCLPVKATEIFNDEFELGTGYSPSWTGTTASGVIAIATDYVHDGVNASKSTIDPSEYARVYKTFTNTADVYTRFYFRIDSLIQTAWRRLCIANLRNSESSIELLLIELYNMNPANAWRITYRSAGSLTAITDSDNPPTASEWRCVELFVNCSSSDGTTDGSYSFYVDGSLVWSISDIDTDSTFADQLRVGVETSNEVTYTHDVWVDCVIIADGYIGPESAGTAYIADFSQSLTLTFDLAAKTDYKLDYSQSITSTWNLVSQWTANIDLELNSAFSWAIDIIHTLFAGAGNYIVDFTLGLSSTWNIITRWNALATLTQAVSSTWNIDLIQGLQYIADLTLDLISTWSIEIASVSLDPFTVALAIGVLGLIFALAAISLAMLNRRS